MSYDDFQYFDIDVRDHVAFVVLNGPHEGNALDGKGHNELSRVVHRLSQDPDVYSAVISGADDVFSVGSSPSRLNEVTENNPSHDQSLQEVRDMVYGAINCDKPIVCAINGEIVGGLMTFALTCDIVIIERHVALSDHHVPFAITAGDGGVLTWPLAMSLLTAKRYLLTGDPLSAEEAEQLGLVTEVVDTGRSVERATQWAERFSRGPQLALRTTKRALNQYMRSAAMTAFDLSMAFEILSLGRPEASAALSNRASAGDGASTMPPDLGR